MITAWMRYGRVAGIGACGFALTVAMLCASSRADVVAVLLGAGAAGIAAWLAAER
jgi:hypothetical protein